MTDSILPTTGTDGAWSVNSTTPTKMLMGMKGGAAGSQMGDDAAEEDDEASVESSAKKARS